MNRPTNFCIEKLSTSLSALLVGAIWFGCTCNAQQEALTKDSATHKPMHSIKPTFNGKPVPFHTFRLSPDRQLWMCCSNNSAPGRGLLLVYDVEGEFQRSIDLSFVPTAIDFLANGSKLGEVFVAGSGKVAKLSPDGEVTETIDAPNVGNQEEALAAMREEARARVGDLLVSVEKQSVRIAKRITELESGADGETEAQASRRLRRLKALQQQAKQIQLAMDSVRSGEAGIDESSLARFENATSLAVTVKYVFVSLPAVTGFGYDVWRLDHNLSQPKKILKQGRGCCGQFDIHTDGTHLVVAENCNFRVAYYDAEGEPVKHFGERETEETDGFGSCCNPMNICCQGDEVLTAESSVGHIRRFSSDGKPLAFIGTAPIDGGCKHVALAHDSTTDRYFMFNEDRKCISVLIPKSQAQTESEDERASRIAMEGLGKQLLGSWQVVPSDSDSSADNSNELAGFLTQRFGFLKFDKNGKLEAPALTEGTESSEQTLALLTKLTGSEESAKSLMQPVKQSEWSAIDQTEQSLRIGFVEDGAKHFQGTIQFGDPNSITIEFSLGSSETVELKFQRSKN